MFEWRVWILFPAFLLNRFFVVEDHILHATQGLVTRAFTDELWNMALSKIIAVLRTHSVGLHTLPLPHTHMEPIGRVGCKMIIWRRRTRKTEPSQSLFFPEKPPFSGSTCTHATLAVSLQGPCGHKHTNDDTPMKRGQNTHTHWAKEEVFGPLMRDRLQQ